MCMQNIFNGVIWFVLPVLLVCSNDTFAYIWGFFLGKKYIQVPLINLSVSRESNQKMVIFSRKKAGKVSSAVGFRRLYGVLFSLLFWPVSQCSTARFNWIKIGMCWVNVKLQRKVSSNFWENAILIKSLFINVFFRFSGSKILPEFSF